MINSNLLNLLLFFESPGYRNVCCLVLHSLVHESITVNLVFNRNSIQFSILGLQNVLDQPFTSFMRYWYLGSNRSLPINFWLVVYLTEKCISFSDPDPHIISIVYRWSGIDDRSGLCFCVFSPVTSSKIILYLVFYFWTYKGFS